jgi:hypothetical protein
LLQPLCGCLVYGEDLLGTGGAGGSGASTGSSSTTGQTTSATETGQPCTVPGDCPETGSPCKVAVCTSGACAVSNVEANTELPDPEPGNCVGLICDSAGSSIAVEDSKDIEDDGNPCTADSCEVGKPKHTPKLGFACGPQSKQVCNDKGNCVECISSANCPPSIQCKDYKCVPASCNDGTKNGTETDTDCGGSCPDCAMETDVDCGGPTCPACADNKTCSSGTDCVSQVCTATKCAAPTCSDGKKNGTETDVDCGGPACPACALDHLVINEIDYDQVSTDTAEFVEIFNATVSPVDLAGIKLVLVDGTSNNIYTIVDLGPAGTLAAGQYLVVGPAGLPIAAGALKVNFTGTQNQIQNGLAGNTGAPDGVALVNDTTDQLIDVVSYEGAITTANLTSLGLGIVSLVEGVAINASVKDEAGGSLCRLPNAKDTGNAAADWALCSAPTPGAANVP